MRDRMLLVELLDVDEQGEMPEVMNLYRIPMAAFDGWIGAPYGGGDEPRALADDDRYARSPLKPPCCPNPMHHETPGNLSTCLR